VGAGGTFTGPFFFPRSTSACEWDRIVYLAPAKHSLSGLRPRIVDVSIERLEAAIEASKFNQSRVFYGARALRFGKGGSRVPRYQ
jgi:hypothetical protein